MRAGDTLPVAVGPWDSKPQSPPVKWGGRLAGLNVVRTGLVIAPPRPALLGLNFPTCEADLVCED